MSTKIPVQQFDPQQSGSTDLYEKRQKIQPRFVRGVFQHLRNAGAWLVLGLYFGIAWFNYHGRQALLFDLSTRRFYIFGWTFWPQDFILLAWLLIIAAFALFAATVFAGRIWCGYLCFQTVWTKVFLLIERWTEGDRNARMRLDKAPVTLNKILRRGLKHFGWFAVALATGVTLVGYFDPIRSLWHEMKLNSLSEAELVWIFVFTVLTYLNAGWMREQICMYVCPYGRFQSVMFDRDTLIISYDHNRGEPRGNRKRETNYKEASLGECIDCTLCVQVCPTGIDIRDGLQFECIACAACIDACDNVMDHMGYPRGLIRYTTENNLEHGKPIHIMRPRLIGYAFMIAVVSALFVFTLSTRNPLAVDVIRDRNALYRETSDGLVENSYVLNIMNKTQQTESVDISFSGLPKDAKMQGEHSVRLAPGEFRTVTETIEEDPEELHERETDIDFKISEQNQPAVSVDSPSRFFAPSH